MPRAKVYAADIDGIHEWVVAAPNQRAALDAFGVHQDLFSQGRARVTTDAQASEAALAEPGVPLRRPSGSKEAFRPAGLGGEAAWAQAAEAAAKAAPKKKKPPSRAKLDAAEAALKTFEGEAEADRQALEAERRALARRAEALEAEQAKQRERLKATLAQARRAYEAADGRA